ncbi:Athe_2463 domain-containing protein [Desulforamulus hydrothermalis]|uniref:Uncharacterized protein n=1 Tax=Desulforamulus hydrothermalis Lam5 = DSM 18033 TaxID=1121428 RepID=K8EB43_9FIRM|nr:hypothetical protein [Desulforamulus hydrothermalis]CCO08858.1 conserved exported hypothetical protein [Desulforamulus hydrothermalis Lam5 = DSM 18033]SHG73381.1 hypothetical protein SAMN02745177_00174 [Desulforamulus hydrothermalis Lam5 = DSM 18033]
MKKFITLFLITIFVFSMAGFANAEPANITEALATANDELRDKNNGTDYFKSVNKQGKPINEANWAKSRLFTYGTPQEASPGKNDFDPVTNQYRYHGYTRNGEKYTNTFFRNDTTDTLDVNSANWIPWPWANTAVQNFVTNVMREPALESNNPFNNDPALLKSIIMGMENVTQYNPYIKFKRDSRQWQQYVHILQPPTKYTFGMGRLFHMKNGNIWYLTIPLTPLALTADPDFSVTLEVEKFRDTKPGDKVTSTVTYKLNQDHPRAERAWLRLHHQVGNTEYPVKLQPLNPADAPNSNGYVTFQPGESKTYKYTFTVQSTSKKIIARINPVDSANDKDWNNNRDEADIFSGYDVGITVVSQYGKDISIERGKTDTLPFLAIIKRYDQEGGTIPVKLTLTGPGGTVTKILNMTSGQRIDVPYKFTVNSTPKTYKVHGEVWPPDKSWEDIKPKNNVSEASITTKTFGLAPGENEIRVNLGGI